MGTPRYMAPEQIRGEFRTRTGRIHRLSDIYAMGVILYELLTGTRPFSGSITQVVFDHLHTPPPRFNEKAQAIHVHPSIEAVVLRCLNKDPPDRPRSAWDCGTSSAKRSTNPELMSKLRARRPQAAALPQGVRRRMSLFSAFLRKLGRSLKGAITGSASAAKPGVETTPHRAAEPIPVREIPGTVRRRRTYLSQPRCRSASRLSCVSSSCPSKVILQGDRPVSVPGGTGTIGS